MTKTAQHSLTFRLWIRLRGFLALLIVLFGIVVGLVSLILPNEELYKPYVVDMLAKSWGKQVEITKISGKWYGFGPFFSIDGLVISDPQEDEVVVQNASLKINVFQYLIPGGSTGIKLGVSDIEVGFERKKTGKIVLTDSNIKKESFSKKLEDILSTGTLFVNNLSINLRDSIHDTHNKINSKITVQQNKNHKAFSLELQSEALADKFIIKSITKKSKEFMKESNWYIETDNLSLSGLGVLINQKYLPKALVDAQVWLSTKKGNVNDLVATANFHDKLFSQGDNEYDIIGDAELVYKGTKKDWQAELVIKDIETKSISQERIVIQLLRKDNFIYLKADVLDIPLLKAITQIVNISNDEFNSLALNGKLTDVTIKYDVNLRRIVDTNIEFHQIDFSADFLQLNNMTGSLSLHNDQIRLLIDSDQGSAEIPGIIRGKVQWDKLLMTAQTSMQDDDLDIKINSLWCDCNDFIIDGAARVSYDKQLFMDLTFAVYDATVNQLYKYWPSIKWKPKILNFLDQALISGSVEQGMIIYHGQTSDYPFENNEGIFWTKSNLKNARIKYHKDWPVVDGFDAVVDTINTELLVKSRKGHVLDAKIDNVVAHIGNFKKPLLTVDIKAHGKDNFLIDFLKKSPMKNGINVLKEDIVLKGKQSINVKLAMPLDKPNFKVEPIGNIEFSNTDFQMGQFQLQDLKGVLNFKGFSLILNDIKSKFLNQDVIASGEIINKLGSDTQLNILLKGDYDVENFETVLGLKLPATGASPWLFTVSNTEADSKLISFKGESDLTGIKLDIPEPFAKPAQQSAPFSISCTLPCIDTGWDMSYADKLSSHFKLNLNSNEFQLNKLVFGDETQATINKPYGGNIDILDVDKWISLFSSNKNTDQSKALSESLPFKQMSLHVNTLVFMARELHDVNIDVVMTDDAIVFNIKGINIEGKVTVSNDIERRGIIVQLEKLHWQIPEKEIIETVVSQVTSSYPALHVWIGDFVYDGIPLGESSIEVRPVVEGIRVEKFNTSSQLLKLNINGVWLREHTQGSKGISKFNIIMTSPNIAEFLATLGFAAPISQADTIIDMRAQWLDLPGQFEIKNISGQMRIEVGKGEVVDADPGMGRILGLFSLTNLPRRLILDFKDVFGKGLHFQSMQGDFTLEEGQAYTDNFVIDSSSAEILIKGHTGLANQDYDQMVIVTPRVGRILPTIGAITGGAVGAAAGFLVQGMFHKGLKKVGKIIYKVTGSWDNPIITLIETKETGPIE